MVKRLTKVDRWMIDLAGISARFGVALVETWDGARITDRKSGRELGRYLQYVCGLYTSHRIPSYSRKELVVKSAPRNLQGFVAALNALSEELSVRLELRSAAVFLTDVETMEPLGRLINTASGYQVEELLPA